MNIRNKFSPRVPVYAPPSDGTSRVQEHFKDEVDINKIVAKYRKTGVITHVQRVKEKYGEFLDIFDVAGQLDKVAKANQAFDQLPSELRNKVGNSIPKFLEYIQDPQNLDQCVKWGIYKKKPVEEPAAGNPAGASEPQAVPGAKKNGQPKKLPVMQPGTTEGEEA